MKRAPRFVSPSSSSRPPRSCAKPRRQRKAEADARRVVVPSLALAALERPEDYCLVSIGDPGAVVAYGEDHVFVLAERCQLDGGRFRTGGILARIVHEVEQDLGDRVSIDFDFGVVLAAVDLELHLRFVGALSQRRC